MGPMRYELGSSGKIIEIPAGFVTDFASIPERLWSVVSPHAQYSRAAIIHDYLFWAQPCSFAQANNLFLIAMIESGVSKITRDFVYAGVVAFGKSSWEENRALRARGVPRVVPMGRDDFPPDWSWEEYRKLLSA